MVRLLLALLLALSLVSCGDNPAPEVSQNEPKSDQQAPSEVETVTTSSKQQVAAVSPPAEVKQETSSQSDYQGGVVSQIKEKASNTADAIKESTKDWNSKWAKMNENRIETDDPNETEGFTQEKADIEALKNTYEKVKDAAVSATQTVVEKAKEMSE